MKWPDGLPTPTLLMALEDLCAGSLGLLLVLLFGVL